MELPAYTNSSIFYYFNKSFFTLRNGRKDSLIKNPTRNAATSVPSRTPVIFPRKINEKITAAATIEQSNMIFNTPNGIWYSTDTVRIKPSAGM